VWNDKFPINSLHLMRGYLFVNSDKKDKYFDLCFDAYWKNNEDMRLNKDIKIEIKTITGKILNKSLRFNN